MSNSGKTSKYRVLCVAIALGCSLFGILLGVSLNLNSHDVLASYRSSMTTLAQNNAQFACIVDAECDKACQQTNLDTVMQRKAEELTISRKAMHQYLDSLRAAFILFVDGEPNEQLRRLNAVSESTYFMMDQGNAHELRKRLQQYQNQLNSSVGTHSSAIDFGLQEQYTFGEREDWEDYYFEDAMSVEVVNQLNLIEQQLLMAELNVFRSLAEEKGITEFINN